jgi:hypothetical protein
MVVSLLKFLTPTNIVEERIKFFSSRKYNPAFKYNRDFDFEGWIKRRPKYKSLVEAVLVQDTEKIMKSASNLFETDLTPNTLKLARNIVKNKPVLLESEPTHKIIESFETAFRYFDLDYQPELTNEEGFNFRPRYSEKKILIGKNLSLQYYSIDGEVKHEMLHIIRYENSKFNNIEKSAAYLPTEEGLATYFHDYVGKNGKAALFQHAAEYLVTEIGIKSSLREMFDYLRGIGFNKKLAWQRAIRHKFGFINTSELGDIMKPSMYFYNEQKIKKLTDGEKLRLMVGRITLEELIKYPEYKGKISSEKIIEFYKLKI